MKTAPKTGQKLLLVIGENEWCSVGYFDRKLGWVAEHRTGMNGGILKVDPVGWEPHKSAV